MEPLRGGSIVSNLSDKINEIIDNASTKKSPAGWAFKFLYNNPNISVVLSGMSNLEQIKENIEIADKDGVALSITGDEENTINKLKEDYLLGVTFIHYYGLTWDLFQESTNLETSIT